MNAYKGLEMAEISTFGSTAERRKSPLISDYVFTTAPPLAEAT